MWCWHRRPNRCMCLSLISTLRCRDSAGSECRDASMLPGCRVPPFVLGSRAPALGPGRACVPEKRFVLKRFSLFSHQGYSILGGQISFLAIPTSRPRGHQIWANENRSFQPNQGISGIPNAATRTPSCLLYLEIY